MGVLGSRVNGVKQASKHGIKRQGSREQHREFDPFVRQIREKVGKNDFKMYNLGDLREFLPLNQRNMHF